MPKWSDRDKTNLKRAGKILRSHGITSHQQLVEAHDENSTYRDYDGIGRVRGLVLRQAVHDTDPDEWKALTGLDWM